MGYSTVAMIRIGIDQNRKTLHSILAQTCRPGARRLSVSTKESQGSLHIPKAFAIGGLAGVLGSLAGMG